jgi:hypothetical protein
MKGAFAIKSKKTPYQVCSEASSKQRVPARSVAAADMEAHDAIF